MGRVVLKHYPASQLPDELRGEISVEALVNIVIEEDLNTLKPMTRDELRAILSRNRTGPDLSIDEAVQRIRHLRDEWKD